ncbi:hypothetical protein ACWGPQ_07025 [Saccharomonospora azurea]
MSYRPVLPTLPLDLPRGHLAFPSVARLDDGRLLLVWRRGSDHYLARDGVIEAAVSDDLGVTWARIGGLADSVDLRDPCVANIGGTVWLTYFKGRRESPADGAFVRRSDDHAVDRLRRPSAPVIPTRLDAHRRDGRGSVLTGRSPRRTIAATAGSRRSTCGSTTRPESRCRSVRTAGALQPTSEDSGTILHALADGEDEIPCPAERVPGEERRRGYGARRDDGRHR